MPATTLNVLAAAWLQFEVHDWFSHGPNDPDDPWFLSLDEADAWPNKPMEIRKTPRDPSSDPSGPQTWVTADSHWWDGSQIYGRDKAFIDKTRTREDGKMRVDPDGMLPEDLDEGLDFTDVPGTHWIGLSILHTLFTLEHNAICDMLKKEYPTWGDDRLYDKARMINGALMAKIHTVDWTPAIIAHPTTKLAMREPVVGRGLGARQAPLRADQQERGHQRHPRLADRPPRRALLADRGVRRRLPDAPADPGRVLVPLAERPQPAVRGARSPS